MPKEIVTCACGCGASFEKFDSKNRPRRYVSGHNPQVTNPALKELVICQHCSSEFRAYKSLRRCFCSRSCKAQALGQRLSQDLDYKERQRQLIKAKGNRPPEHKGEAHWNWKGGISLVNKNERNNTEYRQWRKDVLARFNFTCQHCGIRGGKLSAHHIKEWSKFPALRYDVANGLCLHYCCHMELHGLSKGQRKNENALSKRKAA